MKVQMSALGFVVAGVVVLIGAVLTGTTLVGGWSNSCAPDFPPLVNGVAFGALGVTVVALVVFAVSFVRDR